jgi:hypothetical protein
MYDAQLIVQVRLDLGLHVVVVRDHALIAKRAHPQLDKVLIVYGAPI